MFKLFHTYFHRFNDFLTRRLENSMQFVVPFAWIGIIGFPVFLVLYFKTERWWLNILGLIISLILLLGKNSILLNKKYLPIFWILFLVYILPFDFIYGYLTNPASANYQTGITMMLMGLTIVVSDFIILATILFLGTLLSVLIFSLERSEGIFINHLVHNGLIYSYILALVFALVLTRKKDATEKLKLEGAMTLAHRISHEVNTPLAVLTLAGETLRMHMPKLLKTYKLEVTH